MTNQNIFDIVRQRTNSTTGNLTNATLFLFLNERNRQLCAALQGIREDYFGEISTTNLVGNQQEYLLPDDCMRLKRLEMTFDGVNWRKVTFFDVNQRLNPNDATSIGQDFTTDAPFADVHEASVFLFPIPSASVSNGLKLYYFKRPQDMTGAGQSADLPKEYHSFLTELVTLDAEVTRGRLAPSVALEKSEEIVQIFKRTAAPRNDGEPIVIRGSRQNYR
jgi:hypothetical protein